MSVADFWDVKVAVSPHAAVHHLVRAVSQDPIALCGMEMGLMGWYGTGSWKEIEHVESLRLCARCEQRIKEDRGR